VDGKEETKINFRFHLLNRLFLFHFKDICIPSPSLPPSLSSFLSVSELRPDNNYEMTSSCYGVSSRPNRSSRPNHRFFPNISGVKFQKIIVILRGTTLDGRTNILQSFFNFENGSL
jgi:hypothetical protein